MARKYFKRVFSLIILLGLVMGVVSPIAAAPNDLTRVDQAKSDSTLFSPVVVLPVKSDISPELLMITPAKVENNPEAAQVIEQPLYQLPKADAANSNNTHDESGVQSAMAPAAMPEPLISFEGVASTDNSGPLYPPDTEGDIGPNHYVQWVNLSFAIWSIDKINNTATKVYGPVPGNTLFAGFGGPCQTTNSGDPIALYDPLADRWIMSQFAIPGSAPYFQCIAVSVTGDPMGSWYRYAYAWPGGLLNDYPKFGVWPDAYYMTVNQFNGNTYAGAGVAAFNRSKMIAGDPAAEIVYFNLGPININFGGILPADFDGLTPPPAGAPGLFAEWDDSTWLGDPTDSLRVWKFHVDWITPANSTFGLSGLPDTIIPTLNVDPNMCNFVRNCIPQPGTGVRLDAISDRLMYRLQYRNFGGYQTLVSNHTVDATGADVAGIHWFELHDAGPGWSMFQQGVYIPNDGNNRWMGSAALDHAGNLALGYSVSSTSTYPSIRYAGRLVSDPLGSLPQAEAQIIAGTGFQSGSAGRWGDYSMMGVDPVDDCTFWYTQEYIQTSGSVLWRTRVAAFKFPGCSLLTYAPKTLDVTLEMGTSTTVPITLTNTGSTPLNWYLQEQDQGFTPLGYVPAYVPPAASNASEYSLSQFAKPEVSGNPAPIAAPAAALLLNQLPDRLDGYFSDSDCNFCGGSQSVAENFSLPAGGTVGQIIFWTGYYPMDTPPATDSFTVIFHADSGGLPGAALYTEPNVAYWRSQTGVVLFAVHEWIHTLTLASPVVLNPGNYWVEIYNNTAANPDSFFWETGSVDPIAGLPGSSFALQTPGSSWIYQSSSNFAIQLVAGTVDVPWLSESPVAGTLPASIPMPLTSELSLPDAPLGQAPVGAQDTVNSEAPAEAGEPSEIGLTSVPYLPTSVVYNNGPLVTHPGGGAGGADASATQTALGMGISGWNNSIALIYRIADDIIVSGGSWQINTLTFYAYQTGSSTVSTIDNVNLRIWNGVPGAPGSSIIWGDTTTNRLSNTTWSNIYRVLDTGLTDTTRPVMANTVTVGITLPPGHYWLDWQTGGTLVSGPWAPPITILGQTTTGNGMQSADNGSTWTPVSNIGTQGFPFIVEGTFIPAYQVVQVTFDASVPQVAQPGIYSAQLNINSASPVSLQSLPVTMHVVSHAVNLAADAAGKTASPGQVATYNVTITNMSQGVTDSFDLSLSGNTFLTQLSAATTPVLAPGQSATVQVMVTVPINALVGAHDMVTIQAAFHATPANSGSLVLTTTVGMIKTFMPLVKR